MQVSIIQRKGSSRATTSKIVENLEDAHLFTKQMAKTERAEILFRFGSRVPVKNDYAINTITMIKTTNDKSLSRRLLRDANISIPRTFFSEREIQECSNIRFPLIGQPTYHAGGRGIIISRNMRDIHADMTSTYWAEIIDKDREWRIYTFFGRVIGVEEKIPTDRKAIAWNYSLGNSAFNGLPWRQYPTKACILAIRAANELNIDFAAIDIISKGNKDYVLELNTSPSCSAPRCRCIARAINWVREEIERNNTKPKYLPVPSIVKYHEEILHPCMRK